ncbi:hypothetical protein KKB64_05150 [Patescibacteria group bacterium]|nr:hypothetical protein [Patescibacteria group bacterium]MBU1473139.1 hypothetical protein [Patescibacteria group bacterium]MBU2459530.1 hypothetical protein [Patescibacteria group bacterium]
MTILPKEVLKKFQVLYLQHYHTRLSDEQAEEKALQLLRLFRIVYHPIPNQIEMKKYETNKA